MTNKKKKREKRKLYLPIPKQNTTVRRLLNLFKDSNTKSISTSYAVSKLDPKSQGTVNSWKINKSMKDLVNTGLVEEYTRLSSPVKHSDYNRNWVDSLKQEEREALWIHCDSQTYIYPSRDVDRNVEIQRSWRKEEDEGVKLEEGYLIWRLCSPICYGCFKVVDRELFRGTRFRLLNDKVWRLTFDGEVLVFSMFRPDIPSRYTKFLEVHNDNKVLNLAKILVDSQKKQYVDKLIEDLRSERVKTHLIGKVGNQWYGDIVPMMRNWVIDVGRYPELSEYQKEIMTTGKRIIRKAF